MAERTRALCPARSLGCQARPPGPWSMPVPLFSSLPSFLSIFVWALRAGVVRMYLLDAMAVPTIENVSRRRLDQAKVGRPTQGAVAGSRVPFSAQQSLNSNSVQQLQSLVEIIEVRLAARTRMQGEKKPACLFFNSAYPACLISTACHDESKGSHRKGGCNYYRLFFHPGCAACASALAALPPGLQPPCAPQRGGVEKSRPGLAPRGCF